jgi:hypothetical protein
VQMSLFHVIEMTLRAAYLRRRKEREVWEKMSISEKLGFGNGTNCVCRPGSILDQEYTNITFNPCRNGRYRLPFASLISATAPFHELQCVPPSPPSNHASICSASKHSKRAVISSSQIIQETLEELSEKDEAALLDLSLDFYSLCPPPPQVRNSLIDHSG